MSKQSYESDIELGERYTDTQTGITGVATAIYFFQHSCERVQIEVVETKDGNKSITDYTFDSPRLVNADTGERATVDKPGGPGISVTGQQPGRAPIHAR